MCTASSRSSAPRIERTLQLSPYEAGSSRKSQLATGDWLFAGSLHASLIASSQTLVATGRRRHRRRGGRQRLQGAQGANGVLEFFYGNNLQVVHPTAGFTGVVLRHEKYLRAILFGGQGLFRH